MQKNIFIVSIVLISALFSLNSQAVYESNIDSAINWLSVNQNINGSWGDVNAPRLLYTSLAVEALKSSGKQNSTYFKGVTWLENHVANNSDYLARRAFVLDMHGDDLSSDYDELVNQQDTSDTGRLGWGLSGSYLHSPIDTAIVLKTLASTSSQANIQAAADYLVNTQIPTMGWPISLESSTNAFVTANVLTGLLAVRASSSSYNYLTASIDDAFIALNGLVDFNSPIFVQAVTSFVAYQAGNTALADQYLVNISSNQLPNGSWNDDVYDTTLAIRAMSAFDELDSPNQQQVVFFEDDQLRSVVNLALGRNQLDSITRSELLALTSLVADSKGIDSIVGLEWAKNLTSLDIRNNNVTNVTPVSDLDLTTLLLDGNPVYMCQ